MLQVNEMKLRIALQNWPPTRSIFCVVRVGWKNRHRIGKQFRVLDIWLIKQLKADMDFVRIELHYSCDYKVRPLNRGYGISRPAWAVTVGHLRQEQLFRNSRMFFFPSRLWQLVCDVTHICICMISLLEYHYYRGLNNDSCWECFTSQPNPSQFWIALWTDPNGIEPDTLCVQDDTAANR